MSVCVVGKYPWQAVRECGIDNPYSVFIVSDSRVGVPGRRITSYRPLPPKMAKQRVLSDNLVVCYTSSNIFNTTAAIDRVQGAPTTNGPGSISTVRDIRRIGEFLRKEHKAGGLTELIAVIWEKHYPVPNIFEVMPKKYKPKERKGVIGIGDRRVLRCFEDVFRNPPPGLLQVLEANELRRALKHPPPGLDTSPEQPRPIESGNDLFGALDTVMKKMDESYSTVGYPLEYRELTNKGIELHQAIIRRKPRDWDKVTAKPGELILPPGAPKKSKRETRNLTAVQLAY